MVSQPKKSHVHVFDRSWLPGVYSNLTLDNATFYKVGAWNNTSSFQCLKLKLLLQQYFSKLLSINTHHWNEDVLKNSGKK